MSASSHMTKSIIVHNICNLKKSTSLKKYKEIYLPGLIWQDFENGNSRTEGELVENSKTSKTDRSENIMISMADLAFVSYPRAQQFGERLGVRWRKSKQRNLGRGGEEHIRKSALQWIKNLSSWLITGLWANKDASLPPISGQTGFLQNLWDQ